MLSKQEEHVIRHALCGGTNKKPYRNRFITGEGTDDYPVVEGLVLKSLMSKRRYMLDEINTSFIYSVTEAGARAAGLQLPSGH